MHLFFHFKNTINFSTFKTLPVVALFVFLTAQFICYKYFLHVSAHSVVLSSLSPQNTASGVWHAIWDYTCHCRLLCFCKFVSLSLSFSDDILFSFVFKFSSAKLMHCLLKQHKEYIVCCVEARVCAQSCIQQCSLFVIINLDVRFKMNRHVKNSVLKCFDMRHEFRM